MTESEIIKVLECCSKNTGVCDCACPLIDDEWCQRTLAKAVIDLINRKNAEIEKLCGEVDELIIAKDQLFDEAEALIKKARAEAIKEFAERLKAEADNVFYHDKYMTVDVYKIDQIAKEMGVEL